jgi:hypothetical protein
VGVQLLLICTQSCGVSAVESCKLLVVEQSLAAWPNDAKVVAMVGPEKVLSCSREAMADHGVRGVMGTDVVMMMDGGWVVEL